MNRRWLPWLGLAVVVVVGLTVAIARSEPSNDPEARARRVERRIACPVCTGESVAESNAPESRAIKAEIRDLIAAGRTDTEIIELQVDRFGERVRLNPEGDGIGLIAWGVPVVALIAGVAGIAVALRRWTSQPRLAASSADEEVVRQARETDVG